MSGRVDPIRIKKQSFDVFRVMQSTRPCVKLLGHWNYPPLRDDNYRCREKVFNGKYWQETDRFIRRDPTQKTVYCVASYPVMSVKLLINGVQAGVCAPPEHDFIYAFPGVNILNSGKIEAVAFDGQGNELCRDCSRTASVDGLPPATMGLTSIPSDISALSTEEPAALIPESADLFREDQAFFYPIPESDRQKYTPEDKEYCKIMFNGQEPDFRGVRAVNQNGAIRGNVLCILERIRVTYPDVLEYDWNKDTRVLTVRTGGHTLTAVCGETHLKIDRNEELMDGVPYVTPEGIPVMDVSAVAGWIEGASVRYDNRIHALRIEIKR